jgi:hypothetical protein
MNGSHTRFIGRALWPALALLAPLIATAADGVTPLIDKVRNATARYIDINAAFADSFVVGTPCVSGPDTGAMGVHLVRPDRIGKFLLDPTQPQALIYEPTANGSMRLVGVEFIVLAQNLTAATTPPALEGNLMNYIESPNRYGLPAFYEIHVWAWQDNPKGSYADWNTHVTCAHQPLPQ